jgi:hypothetical protein
MISGMWGDRQQIPASPWRSWNGAMNGGLGSMSSDVYGGPNNNQFNLCMLSTNKGLAAWKPHSGYVNTSGDNVTNRIYFCPFTESGGAINAGTVAQYNASNINMNVSLETLTPISATQVIASHAVTNSFANYTTYFQLITVDTVANTATVTSTTGVDSGLARVNDCTKVSATKVLFAMQGGFAMGGIVGGAITWGAVSCSASGFQATKIYALDATHVAMVGIQVSGPVTTPCLKIFSLAGYALTEVSGINLIKGSQDVVFLSPTRFITYWGSSNQSVANLVIGSAFQIAEEPAFPTTINGGAWTIGPTGFTADGATALIQYQNFGGWLQMRVVDVASDLWIGPWVNVSPLPGYHNTTWGAWRIDASRFIAHWTDQRYDLGAANGRLMVISR